MRGPLHSGNWRRILTLPSEMYPESIQKLIELFAKFPGIGPRQAARFAFFLFKENHAFIDQLRAALQEVRDRVALCEQCFRTMEQTGDTTRLCSFCRDARRDRSLVAVVEKESDMSNMEKAGAYHGLYHVLSGVISPLDNDSPKKIRLRELHERVERLLSSGEPCEVILATNSTTEGDMTALYIERILSPLKDKHPSFKVTRLGRGLSLGAELEYIDEVTIKNALINRK